MRRFLAGLTLCVSVLALPALAGPSLHVTSAAVCESDAEDCDAEARTFSGVPALRFVTTVEGATGEAWVEHVWKYEGREVFRMKLAVHAHRFRTVSRKSVAGHPGPWTVTVLDPVGRELATLAFQVEEPPQSTH